VDQVPQVGHELLGLLVRGGVARAMPESGFPDGTTRPDTADLIAITADQGVSPAALEQRVRTALHGGAGYTIAAGAARGDLANINLPVERSTGQQIGFSLIPLILVTALFALAATTALAVSLRGRRYALLRAMGATRGLLALPRPDPAAELLAALGVDARTARERFAELDQEGRQ
jgi:hypothetical protein